jgi:hypothetical protein
MAVARSAFTAENWGSDICSFLPGWQPPEGLDQISAKHELKSMLF